MELALDAILGHKSAHSLATGPVMAEPKTHQTKTIVNLWANDAENNCANFKSHVLSIS